MKRADAFLSIPRQPSSKRKVLDRIKDFREFVIPLSHSELEQQAERCMDCGIPFCHGTGCPVRSLIPAWNVHLQAGRWREALELLHECNVLPEVTGRVCPAPCETACTLAVDEQPVTIQQIELAIIEYGFEQGWITPRPPSKRTGKQVAVIGSGPAGLSAAHRLNRLGHSVTVLEKADRIGGLLRYGIPDFKLEKRILDRRIDLMMAEGVAFLTEVEAGKDLSARYLLKQFHAICLAAGAEEPRRLDIPGSDLKGVHLAVDYLTQQNRRNAGDSIDAEQSIHAKDKICVVLGGGDTGADCIGTARRQGAKEIYQFEILPKPPERRTAAMLWPTYPRIYRRGSSHEEGCDQRWNISTRQILGQGDRVVGLKAVEVEWNQSQNSDRWEMIEKIESEFELECDIILLALGFTGPKKSALLRELGVQLTEAGRIKTNAEHRTSVEKVFCAGDVQNGPSLVVTAIQSGQEAAGSIHEML